MVGVGDASFRGIVPGMYHPYTTPGDPVRNTQIVFVFNSFWTCHQSWDFHGT